MTSVRFELTFLSENFPKPLLANYQTNPLKGADINQVLASSVKSVSKQL